MVGYQTVGGDGRTRSEAVGGRKVSYRTVRVKRVESSRTYHDDRGLSKAGGMIEDGLP